VGVFRRGRGRVGGGAVDGGGPVRGGPVLAVGGGAGVRVSRLPRRAAPGAGAGGGGAGPGRGGAGGGARGRAVGAVPRGGAVGGGAGGGRCQAARSRCGWFVVAGPRPPAPATCLRRCPLGRCVSRAIRAGGSRVDGMRRLPSVSPRHPCPFPCATAPAPHLLP